MESYHKIEDLPRPLLLGSGYAGSIAVSSPSERLCLGGPIMFSCSVDRESTAVEFSKFQFSTRDLSLLVNKNIQYSEIVEKIETLKLENLKKVYPIDLFALEEKNSLTVRFEFQSMEKTLSDEEIENDISKILTILNEELNISLR